MLDQALAPCADRSQRPTTFDAPGWLAAWADHGGVVMLAGEHLYVGRGRAVDRAAHQRLDSLRDQLLHQQAGSVLADMLRRRSFGEHHSVARGGALTPEPRSGIGHGGIVASRQICRSCWRQSPRFRGLFWLA
jgi:hypothetical protein